MRVTASVFKIHILCICLSMVATETLQRGRAQGINNTDLHFEVNTVKQGNPNDPNSNINYGFGSNLFSTENVSLETLLQYVYTLPGQSKVHIQGAPTWFYTQRFDIQAKESVTTAKHLENVPQPERERALQTMLIELLRDRFALTVHTETKSARVLVLQLSKGSAKLKASVVASTPDTDWSGLHNDGHGFIEGRHATIAMLIDTLSEQPDAANHVIVDRTNLTGAYSFTLRFWPSERTDQDGSNPNLPSLSTALHEQLGLDLNMRTSPVASVVVDHVELPTPN